MERRTFMKLAGAAALSFEAARPAIAQGKATVRWWYHYDNPQNTPASLVAKFEAENPDIKIQAEPIPWGGGTDYINRIFSALVAGNQPDCAMVRLSYLSRFSQMKALEPLDGFLASWKGRSDISDDVWTINRSPDGKQYYMPLHYVVIYLYYRQDLLQQAGLQPPKSFDDFLTAAKALTKDGIYGYGMRGGAGCHDNWGPFVLGGGASFDKGGMVTEKALAANRWFVDLAVKHKVAPPSAPTDAFRQIVDAFKAGRTGMAIHHIGSVAEIVGALGDKVSAVPVPRGPDGRGWTYFGDESNAIFAGSKNKEAAFRWISFLSSAENNAEQAKLSGQLPITISDAKSWTVHPKRFVEASDASLPIAKPLPDHVKTPDFVGRVLPTNLQRALTGGMSPDDLMKAVEQTFHG
ncbi:sugar ABC transporter substrate-binding protein [Bosea sp. SSUT16]|uniref:Sugar ABC transporter substrate-binding protein n=1 Tax=Bosea spartocytisi TaxID=2773451 RepID=A0A927HXG2_9HYPH|nr:sugar ABC transporter substrate-binding protein [Bosea spartocytisi]MBD3844169.1 sugar ABC transporter substrate-binding protein [Bosea spartocytisi]MCT4470722.1 sugar ABC transporter substrate-binding protein [Bosea spartocytisi]